MDKHNHLYDEIEYFINDVYDGDFIGFMKDLSEILAFWFEFVWNKQY